MIMIEEFIMGNAFRLHVLDKAEKDDAVSIEAEGPDGQEDHGTATHWMPLPEPPEQQEQGENQ